MKSSDRESPARSLHSRVTVKSGHRGGLDGMHRRAHVTVAGKTAHFEISYVTSLGTRGAELAQALLDTCERDYDTLQRDFGGATPQRMPFVVQVTADATGASHSSCLGTDIAVGGNSGAAVDFIRSLLVAEEDEVFMATFGRGWDCGASAGEGLSRVLANDIYAGAEPADFVSSNSWLNLDPRPNFVDHTDPTDTNYESIGCAVLFLNWLRFQLDHPWSDVIAAGGATLAGTYLQLVGKNTGWDDFQAAMAAAFPVGGSYTLTTDNPFPLKRTHPRQHR